MTISREIQKLCLSYTHQRLLCITVLSILCSFIENHVRWCHNFCSNCQTWFRKLKGRVLFTCVSAYSVVSSLLTPRIHAFIFAFLFKYISFFLNIFIFCLFLPFLVLSSFLFLSFKKKGAQGELKETDGAFCCFSWSRFWLASIGNCGLRVFLPGQGEPEMRHLTWSQVVPRAAIATILTL